MGMRVVVPMAILLFVGYLNGRQLAPLYCTAIVTVFDEDPPVMVSTTGTMLPFEDPAGTCAFTWYKPTSPGVRQIGRAHV